MPPEAARTGTHATVKRHNIPSDLKSPTSLTDFRLYLCCRFLLYPIVPSLLGAQKWYENQTTYEPFPEAYKYLLPLVRHFLCECKAHSNSNHPLDRIVGCARHLLQAAMHTSIRFLTFFLTCTVSLSQRAPSASVHR